MKETESQFGLPKVDNTPTGLVEMEGSFFRGMTNSSSKPLWVRVLSVIFFIFCFVIPGIFLVFIGLFAYKEGGVMSMLMPLSIGLVLMFAGLGGLKTNLKKKTLK